MNWLAQQIEKNWQRSAFYNSWLFPFWLLFVLISSVRRFYYRVFPAQSYFSPVVVIGNISVGGTGKTPLIEYLLKESKKRGLKAGVIARGYGGQAQQYPLRLDEQTLVEQSGDEPFMLYQNSQVPFVVDPVRTRAVKALLGDKLDVIFSDDGLQHYGLARDYEVVVVDAQRGFGNGWQLPIGPLREPISRLEQVDLVLKNGEDFRFKPSQFVHLKTGEQCSVEAFVQKHDSAQIKALAGIGNPQRFFNSLNELGLCPDCEPLSDHHAFSADDLADKRLTIMTEKDAVKCLKIADNQHWYLKVELVANTQAQAKIDDLFAAIKKE